MKKTWYKLLIHSLPVLILAVYCGTLFAADSGVDVKKAYDEYVQSYKAMNVAISQNADQTVVSDLAARYRAAFDKYRSMSAGVENQPGPVENESANFVNGSNGAVQTAASVAKVAADVKQVGAKTTVPPQNVLETITIPDDPAKIDSALAAKILKGLGFAGKNPLLTFQRAAIGYWLSGKSYAPGVLNLATKKKLAQMARMYQAALAKYPADATITKKDPRFQAWMDSAALKITNLPQMKDVRGNTVTANLLIGKVILQESGELHWKDRKVEISNVGAVGFMQVMPFHASSSFNIYDPEQNLAFGGKFLNELLQNKNWKLKGETDSQFIAKVLAAYNGGPERPAFKTMTWDQIVASDAIPAESIHYAIKIRKTMNLAVSATEQAWYKKFMAKN